MSTDNEVKPEGTKEIVGSFCSDCLKKRSMLTMYAVVAFGVFLALATIGVIQIYIPWPTWDQFFIALGKIMLFIGYSLLVILALFSDYRGIKKIKEYCNPNLKPYKQENQPSWYGEYDPHDSERITETTFWFLISIFVWSVTAWVTPSFLNILFS